MGLCSPKCMYFPDMSVAPGEWERDKKRPYIKKRKQPQVFLCGYDNHIINWKTECPRKDKHVEEKAKENH